MNKNQIIKTYGTDYADMTMRLLERADLKSMVPSKDSCIGIKPNLVSPSPASYGATTHPEILEGIIRYLQKYGFTNILICEGSWVGDKTADSFEAAGYQYLVDTYHVPFVDCQKEKFHTVDCAGLPLQICNVVDRVDFLINVPVLKGHCQTKITCALKNMKGLIPNKEKRHFHAMGLHKPIAHLATGIHQDFIVVDHICGDLDFEDGGNPVVRNCIMAAMDPVLVDAYVCRLLDYTPEDVPYVRMAEELGAGCADLEHAEILSLDKSDEMPLPKHRKIVQVKDVVEEVESCSACYGYLMPVLDKLREEGLLEKLDCKIAIGQGYQGKTGKLGIGRCTKDFEFCVMGCPPTDNQIYDALKQYLVEKR